MSDSGLPRRLEETRPLSSAPGQRRESRWRVETAALRVPDSLSCAQPGPSTRRRRSRARSTGPSEPRRSAPPSALGTRRPASRPLSLARLAPSQAPPPPRRGATQACAAPRLSGGRVLPRPCRTGCRSDIATAHCITALMRWRSRRAVSGLWCQRGLSISSTSVARDFGDGSVADPRKRVSLEARRPVLGVLGVAPAGPLLFEHSRGADGEGSDAASPTSLRHRIAVGACESAVGEGLFSGLLKRHHREAAESEFAPPVRGSRTVEASSGGRSYGPRGRGRGRRYRPASAT